MLMKILVCALVAVCVAAVLTLPCQRLMNWFLQRNADSLAEYDLQPGPVASNAVVGAGVTLAMFMGLFIPVSVVGRMLSCFLLCWLWLLWLIDYAFQFIFDDSLLPLLVLALVATPWLPYSPWQRLLAGAGALILLAVLAIIGRGALGGGDVKLMGVLGLWFGVHGIVTTASVGFMLGGAFAILMLLLRLRKRKDYFAFGPFLIIGAVVAWLGQVPLWK